MFVIAYSGILTCLIINQGRDLNRKVVYGFVVDCQNLIDPPIPFSYFGNCIKSSSRIPLKAETFMGEEGFLSAARFVSDFVEKFDENMARKVPNFTSLVVLQ